MIRDLLPSPGGRSASTSTCGLLVALQSFVSETRRPAAVGYRGASVSVLRLGTPGSPSGRPSRRRTTSSASASTSSTSEPADTHGAVSATKLRLYTQHQENSRCTHTLYTVSHHQNTWRYTHTYTHIQYTDNIGSKQKTLNRKHVTSLKCTKPQVGSTFIQNQYGGKLDSERSRNSSKILFSANNTVYTHDSVERRCTPVCQTPFS